MIDSDQEPTLDADRAWRMHRFAGNCLDCERLLHVALKVYHDSSSDEKKQSAITLTGVAATESIWSEFELNWAAVTERYSVTGLHMAELMGFHGEFATWDEKRRDTFLSDLWNVVGSFRTQHLVAYSCSVILPDFRRAKNEIPSLCSPQSMCVNFCVGGLHLPEECAGESKPIILYFDRTERFMHKVNRVWLRRRRVPRTLFNQIRNIIPVDDTERPIQLADMLAWIANNEAYGRNYPDRDRFSIGSVLMIEHFKRVYDYENIILHYPTGQLETGRIVPSSKQ